MMKPRLGVYCVVCDKEPVSGFGLCRRCQRSYDRMLKQEDETIWSVLAWAAVRARYAERQRQEKLVRELQHSIKHLQYELNRRP